MPDAGRTRSLACKCKKHATKSPQVRRNSPAFPARWFTAYTRSPRGTAALFLPRASAANHSLIAPVASPETSAKLDTSVGVSGPRVFARPPAASLASRYRGVHRSLPQRTWRLAVTPHPGGTGWTQHIRIFISVKTKFLKNRTERCDRLETIRENRALAPRCR
jgi:hypothetical protein